MEYKTRFFKDLTIRGVHMEKVSEEYDSDRHEFTMIYKPKHNGDTFRRILEIYKEKEPNAKLEHFISGGD